ncbi:soma ferritin-like [Saccostrea echinata]|uniref:soma ferritin-like n=1 Tax=Saccostrea echinata TaxID=191078 RepID=UPI002A83D0AD|nr:soma ferritin-like [Saccostrea echinata]
MIPVLLRQCTYGRVCQPSLSRSFFLKFYTARTMSQSQPRQNFHEESEAGINRQINMELYASYTYQSMAMYFDRDDVALPGFSKFFSDSSSEEREHAEKLMKYQNKRGGRIVLQDIKKPDRDEWGTGLDAMQVALQLEKSVNQSLLDLHKVADSHSDAQMTDFIESNYLEEQVNAIKEISDHITQLKRVGAGLGEYMYDKQLQS